MNWKPTELREILEKLETFNNNIKAGRIQVRVEIMKKFLLRLRYLYLLDFCIWRFMLKNERMAELKTLDISDEEFDIRRKKMIEEQNRGIESMKTYKIKVF